MQVSATTRPPAATDADTVAMCIFEGDGAPEQAPAELAELLVSGEASAAPNSLAVTHAQGKRWLAVGAGPREQFTAERARVAAAVARERARELSARALCWIEPPGADAALARALVEGTLLADYRFDRYKSSARDGADAKAEDDGRPKHLDAVIVSSGEERGEAVAQAAVIAEA